MQIVRDLAGYTWGRSDLVRRAMSKKKGHVMEEERKNFVYGNEAEGVKGCIANGIPEEVANGIYDRMIDFAKYAFNKSHAAAYAVVAYQTAWLKQFYPVEYMAALMSSVIDNTTKVSEYIYASKDLGISLLPPNINQGGWGFSADHGQIRYGLSAIKSVGRNVIDSIVRERTQNGPFVSLQDFCERVNGREMNKRALEAFIKAGCFDGLGGTRKQFMCVYNQIVDSVASQKKNVMDGQMSLFDFMDSGERSSLEVRLPNVGEYPKSELLAYEKEVLGIYVSGHPLDEYRERWQKHITAVSSDFLINEETGVPKVEDDSKATVGGIITSKRTMITKQNKMMAFLVLEDRFGTLEIVVFPNQYERYSKLLVEDARVFIEGRVNNEDEKDGKLICEKVYDFEDTRKELWIQFEDLAAYQAAESEMLEILDAAGGKDLVFIYLKKEKQMKALGTKHPVQAKEDLRARLGALYGDGNVKIREK